MNRALFLDRDGILDELVYYESSGEWESPRRLEDLIMIEGVSEPLRRLVDAGWLLVIITNQPSYAKGKTSREELLEVQAAVIERLGVPIAASYLCFHHPEAIVEELRIACACRKPGAQSLRDAALSLEIDLARSWMIGDQDTDLAAGRSAGCRVALLEHPRSANKRGAIEPDVRVRDLGEMVEVVLSAF
jgi:D-glycero-D-manno-heptose 1,7-bisphosphate phosphatase